MALNIEKFKGLKASTRPLELDRLPLTLRPINGRSMGLFFMFFALIWGGMPGYWLVQEWRSMGGEAAIAAIFPVVGLGLFIFGLFSVFRRRTVTISKDFVQGEDRTIRGRREWLAVISSYRGVLLHTVRIRRGKSSYTAYAVRLDHGEAEKSVPLYVSTDAQAARREWERVSRRFDVPAIESSADGEVTRDAEDLDKSVRELAAEGKLEADFDARPPPDGLAAAHEGDELVVTATQPVNNLWLMALVALFPLIFVYVGFSEGGFVYIFAAFGLLFEILIVAGIIWDVLTRQRLRIGRNHVSKQWVAAWGAGRPKRLDADSIESVTITAKEAGRPRQLAIASDDRTLSFGRRQSDEALEWLRQAVLAHIAGE